ncbi:DNA gyrase subunit A [Candidatus Endomicrobiellum trichonymphae]|uniref:DNA gyrase subunit A n=1 Tax=Endomicrobium trichonymphae TaxID=1408204 RepID=UPI000865A1B8|nr:DNA gyrase subunit A [Candidatus Endomicrobium trichonymphae]BAV58584.1 DNA gyrase subunit A [Candidatus Endomicrobium trichonymphae]
MPKEKNIKDEQEILPVSIIPRNIEDEMKNSYIDYAMSVIVGRALPDVRDGLKPVHRRILYAMKEMGLKHNTAYKKSARIVGDVLGKYHPHGDSAVYGAMVRMVQDFSLRYPMIDGQGNFGSIDGDFAAAMRYTEVRMDAITDEMLVDLDKNTVDFIPNYDGSLKEPVILPTKLPSLLINGSAGIAVGMATNIPAHNIVEVSDALVTLIDDKEISVSEIVKYIKGPDFPTGAIILGKSGIKDYMEKGRGSVKIRAKTEIEEVKSGREAIIVNEIPYQVNKANLITSIADLVKDKKIDGIADLRDESDRDGIRIVIEIKRDANVQVVLNQLYKHTQMQLSFGVIMLALVNNRPKVMNVKEILIHHIEHRKVIIIRRTKFDLQKAEARFHILEGLKIAIDNIDAVIKIIKESADEDNARVSLMSKLRLTKIQTEAILEMKIRQLTGLKRKEIDDEYLELIRLIEKLRSVLADPKKVLDIIKNEALDIKRKYGDKRRTQIQAAEADFNIEDLIQEEEVAVTMSHAGYIKRIPLDTYKAQHRGGRGIAAMNTREEDFVENLFITSSHSYMLFFTTRGRLYWMRIYEIPEGARTSKGKAIVNLLQLQGTEEKITAAIPIRSFNPEYTKDEYLLMCTRNGIIKKIALDKFINPRKRGIIAIKLEDGDILTEVKAINKNPEVVIATKKGSSIRFKESDIRVIGRAGRGVKGIELKKGDEVIGMEVFSPDDVFLSISENGYGKRTKVGKYRLQKRAGHGVINMQMSERNGNMIGIKKANDGEEVMIITQNGITIRLRVNSISVIGRNTQGVRLVRLDAGDKVAAIACVVKDENSEEPQCTVKKVEKEGW